MAKPLIVARDLSIVYNKGKQNEFKALSGVNTDIYEGEYIILFGASGSGKSTFMFSIQGSLPPGEGTLLIRGDDIYAYPTSERVYFQRHVMGIIFQQFNLIPSLSTLDNVALPMIFANVERAKRERRAQALLDRFGVGHVSHKIPAMLSGGQQQRVSVSRSMVNDPKILLADEPTGNLDSVSSQQVMDKIDEINTFDRRTIIMVSHNAAHLSYAHRVYYLKDGKVVREVVNPQRKQIKPVNEGETIVTELEELARLFPYDSIETLRVKSLVNYLTQDYTFSQLTRLEGVLKRFLQGKIDRDSLHQALLTEYNHGGVGVTTKTAKHMTKTAEQIIEQSVDIRRFRARKDNDGVFFGQHELAVRLRDHLLTAYHTKLSKQQDENLVEAIAERVTGVQDEEEFFHSMLQSVSSGGVGLPEKTADSLVRYFEKLIAQGVDVSYKS
jgi:putative ABC transport system ATP-binding protein